MQHLAMASSSSSQPEPGNPRWGFVSAEQKRGGFLGLGPQSGVRASGLNVEGARAYRPQLANMAHGSR